VERRLGVRDEGMNPDSVILQDTNRQFFCSTDVESINTLREEWLLCSQRSGCKGDRGAQAVDTICQILHAVHASFEEFG